MKTKTFLVPLMAVLLIALVGMTTAGGLVKGDITTSLNEVELGPGITIAGITKDTVPVRITFTADTTTTDVRVKVWMEGYRDDVSASTNRFNLIEGSVYTKLLSLELPEDLKDTTKNYTLHVSISSPEEYEHEEYTLKMQRESYDFTILSVDYPIEVSSGNIIPISIVVENTGMEEMEDGYVTISIPSLGVTSTKGYFGDLVSVENCDDECDTPDSLQKTVYLKIPENAESGVHSIIVEAYNKESTAKVTKIIKVTGESASTQVIPAVKSQDITQGETKTYELIIVNSADDIKVYNINTISGSELEVSTPSVVTVKPDSSEIVKINVKVLDNAKIGTYQFTAEVNNEQIVFGANVLSKKVSQSAVAITVVLVIIFVVLLIVLILLLTKKEKPIEEAETSYY